jgi:hypothetical protein
MKTQQTTDPPRRHRRHAQVDHIPAPHSDNPGSDPPRHKLAARVLEITYLSLKLVEVVVGMIHGKV